MTKFEFDFDSIKTSNFFFKAPLLTCIAVRKIGNEFFTAPAQCELQAIEMAPTPLDRLTAQMYFRTIHASLKEDKQGKKRLIENKVASREKEKKINDERRKKFRKKGCNTHLIKYNLENSNIRTLFRM